MISMASSEQPDSAMMAAVERIAAFIASGGAGSPVEAFAASDVTILENFAPYLFSGDTAVETWALGMRGHLRGVTGLRHRFGQPCDFSRSGDQVFLSLPTEWSGFANGRAFAESGGWCFVLTKQGEEWRVRNYGWAVTELSVAPADSGSD
jgi:hypothetical protein